MAGRPLRRSKEACLSAVSPRPASLSSSGSSTPLRHAVVVPRPTGRDDAASVSGELYGHIAAKQSQGALMPSTAKRDDCFCCPFQAPHCSSGLRYSGLGSGALGTWMAAAGRTAKQVHKARALRGREVVATELACSRPGRATPEVVQASSGALVRRPALTRQFVSLESTGISRHGAKEAAWTPLGRLINRRRCLLRRRSSHNHPPPPSYRRHEAPCELEQIQDR